MIMHVPGPCPACGARGLWAVVTGTQVARECTSCGWLAVAPGARP